MKNEPTFINRHRELSYLNDWIAERPGNLLFIYGPKSSGKTTLLMEFHKRTLQQDIYDIKHFNLRELLITSYKDFIRSFFRINYEEAQGNIKTRQEYSLPFFRLSVEVLKGLESTDLDAFVVMKTELQKSAHRGQKPVIIIDELQALESIYMNGQRELLKELFNFFVALTKERHLCHVIIASSDGYFIERIYNDSKLKKTSTFLLVDYLVKEDVEYWLNNLEKESHIQDYDLSAAQKTAIWETFGGSMWEITRFLGDLIMHAKDGRVSDAAFDGLIAKQLTAAWAMFENYADTADKRALFQAIAVNVVENAEIGFTRDAIAAKLKSHSEWSTTLTEQLGELVRQNFLSFDPTTARYQVQGRSMELGLLRYAKGRQT